MFFLSVVSAVMTILSVPPWPVAPTIHPAFLDYASSKQGILFSAKNDSLVFGVYGFEPTCHIVQLKDVNRNTFTNTTLGMGRSADIGRQSSRSFSCGFSAPEGTITAAEIAFTANYEWRFLGFAWRRTIETEPFTWDGQRWFEGRPM